MHIGVKLKFISAQCLNCQPIFFLSLAQILFALHILHSSQTSDFLCVLPDYDRPSQSPSEVIEGDGLGNTLVLMLAGR